MKFHLSRHKVSQFAWALYDFANTIFPMNVISLYFALWVTKDHGGKDIYYSLSYSSSMLAVIFLAPLFGKLADLKQQRRLFLILSTMVCVIATAFIGIFNQLAWGLMLFFLANIGFQLALVFYDSLLPHVASRQEYGRISGMGVAFGYMGSILGILLVIPFVHVGEEVMRDRAFVPTAFLFFLFSLPCFFFVREKQGQEFQNRESHLPRPKLWMDALRYPGMLTYLLSMFLVQNAVNTVILFMGVYSIQVGGFTQKDLNLFFVISTIFAVGSAYFQGRLVDRLGPLRVFRAVIWLWAGSLVLAAFSGTRAAFWIVGCLVGIGLAGLWTSSRPLILTFIPEKEAATFFGFNAVAGRFSALVGPILWGMTVWLLEPIGNFRYRVAVGMLAFFAVAGGIVASRLKVQS